MNEKIVSQLDRDSVFVCPVVADASPLEEGVFLIPGGAVDLPPPTVPDGMRARFDGEKFVIEPIPAPVPIERTPEEIADAVDAARGRAYREESDPIFFRAHRGDATMEEWQAKVAEIKARYPDGVFPVGPA